MSDYISRQAAINALPKPQICEYMDEFGAGRNSCAYDAEKAIKDVPAADVVPVVRCRDCENWQTDWNPSIPDRHYCAVMDSMMKADDFCSYGERREERVGWNIEQ